MIRNLSAANDAAEATAGFAEAAAGLSVSFATTGGTAALGAGRSAGAERPASRTAAGCGLAVRTGASALPRNIHARSTDTATTAATAICACERFRRTLVGAGTLAAGFGVGSTAGFGAGSNGRGANVGGASMFSDAAARRTAARSTLCVRFDQAFSSARSHTMLMTRGTPCETVAIACMADSVKVGRSPDALIALRHTQTAIDISGHFAELQRRQPMTSRYPLLHLTEFGPRQQLIQFRLPDQHDLQRLMIGVDVGEETNLLENVGAQVLRFVEDQNRLRLQRHQRIEKLLKHLEQAEVAGLDDVFRIVGEEAEAVESLAEEIVAGLWRGTDDGHDGPRTAPLADHPAQRGLAGPNRPGHHDDRFVARQRVLDLFEGGEIRRALEEKSGARR